MAGFVLSSPVADGGGRDTGLVAGWVWAQKWTAPDVGSINISELGSYAKDNGFEFRLAIFDDDSGNGCPGNNKIANSETGTLSTTAAITYVSAALSPNAVLTGGTPYWIAMFLNGAINISNTASSGINAINVTGFTAYTWPSGAEWETHTDRPTYDTELYAVYAAAGGGLSIPVAMHHYKQMMG